MCVPILTEFRPNAATKLPKQTKFIGKLGKIRQVEGPPVQIILKMTPINNYQFAWFCNFKVQIAKEKSFGATFHTKIVQGPLVPIKIFF